MAAPNFTVLKLEQVLNLCKVDNPEQTNNDIVLKATMFNITSVIAVIMSVVLSFFKKRKFLLPNFLCGRPGVLHPVNLLENQEMRLSYVTAFCITGIHVYEILLEDDPLRYILLAHAPSYTRPLITFVSCFVIAVIYYPIFAALSSKHWFGYIIGGIYSIGHFAIQMKSSMPCWGGDVRFAVIRSFQVFPVYASYAYLIAMFFYRAVKNFCLGDAADVETNLTYFIYVKGLFCRCRQETFDGSETGSCNLRVNGQYGKPWFTKLRQWIYESDPCFRYSLAIQVASALSILTAYILAVSQMRIVFVYVRYIMHVSKIYSNGETNNPSYFYAMMVFSLFRLDIARDNETKFKERMADVEFWVLVTEACLYSALSLTFMLILVSAMCTMKSYRLLLQKQFKGKADTEKVDAPPSSLVMMCKYVGFQVGYTTWGFGLIMAVTFTMLFTVILLLILFIKYNQWDILVTLFEEYGLVVLFIILLLLLQRFLVRVAFLQTIDNKLVLALDNRRVFFVFQFYMVFINAALGFLSCLARLFKGVLFGVWLVPRLDISLMPRVFERFDVGNKSFVNLIRVENYQSNPVLRTFVHILRCTQERNRSTVRGSTTMLRSESSMEVVIVRGTELHESGSAQIRARNRWFLAYTLIQNPTLYTMRKGELRRQRNHQNVCPDQEYEVMMMS